MRSELPLSAVSVYRDGRPSDRVDALGERHLEASWTEQMGGSGTRDLFVNAVRSDGETAWSSPHWSG